MYNQPQPDWNIQPTTTDWNVQPTTTRLKCTTNHNQIEMYNQPQQNEKYTTNHNQIEMYNQPQQIEMYN